MKEAYYIGKCEKDSDVKHHKKYRLIDIDENWFKFYRKEWWIEKQYMVSPLVYEFIKHKLPK